MDGAAFITQFRQETADEVAPYLWSDELILRYLDEAQRELCRLTDGIADSVSSVCTVKVKSALVRVSPLIKKIRAATLVDLERPLSIYSVEEARRGRVPLTSSSTGVPLAIITGVGTGNAQVYPAPTPGQEWTVHLDVLRYPLTRIETSGDELELGDEHVPALMHYALHRAYARPDADTYDKRRSDEELALFRGACREVQVEQSLKRTKSGVTQFSW